MLKTRRKGLVGKGFATIVYVLLLAVVISVSTSPASGTCQSSDCDNDVGGNSTLLFDQFSNSTLLVEGFSNSTSSEANSTFEFNQFSNSTSLKEATSLVLPEQLDIADVISTNNTNQTVPHPMESFQFDSNSNNYTGGSQTGNDNSLHLKGDRYLDENSTARDLKSLTVSAWIKPDYAQGSSVFTVVSDENSFVLVVNNNMPPPKVAIFSIFDGIKWTSVESNSLIPERWTHLAATFNGTTIGIYINGTLEKTSHVAGVPILVDGQLTTGKEENLTSDANVTIGAYYEKTRSQTRDLFSGQISDVNLYGSVLTPEQIDQIFLNTKPTDTSTSSN